MNTDDGLDACRGLAFAMLLSIPCWVGLIALLYYIVK